MFEYLADFITYTLIGLDAETHHAKALHFFIEDVTKIFFLLSVIVTIVSFFRSKLDSDKVRAYLEGKPKYIAYLLAVLLGSVTPFCSCSSIPLFIGFVEAGIPFGVTMTFLITSPMINEIAIAVFASAVGWQLTGVYVATGMIVGLIGGILMDKLGFEKYIIKTPEPAPCCATPKNTAAPPPIGPLAQMIAKKKQHSVKKEKDKLTEYKERLHYAVNYTKDILKKVWLYIVLGIGVGAYLHGYVPEEFFIKYASADNIFSVPFAVIMGVPLYSSATGVIPIAEALLGKGVPVGTVLAMMMSVVAISLPELIILNKVLKARLLVYFSLFLFFTFIIVGYLFNAIF